MTEGYDATAKLVNEDISKLGDTGTFADLALKYAILSSIDLSLWLFSPIRFNSDSLFLALIQLKSASSTMTPRNIAMHSNTNFVYPFIFITKPPLM